MGNKSLTFSEYQKYTNRTVKYHKAGRDPVVYTALGLGGESGEVMEKAVEKLEGSIADLILAVKVGVHASKVSERVKKVLRDKDDFYDEDTKTSLKSELGDVLWYISQLAAEIGVDLGDVAQANLDKLASREARGVIQGSGDDR